jgi:circadian clock protein KaiB
MKSKNNERKSSPPPADTGDGDGTTYLLRLYMTGTTPASMRALANVKRICERHLHGRYQLEVVDLYQQPTLAAGEQIIAAPTLIKQLPLPLRRIIGDMSSEERVLVGLDLRTRAHEMP